MEKAKMGQTLIIFLCYKSNIFVVIIKILFFLIYLLFLFSLRKIPGSFRNIVQFVKFNDVKDDREKIAKETLASVPKQVKQNNIFYEFFNFFIEYY